MNHYLASTPGIARCSVLSFAAGEWFAFRL
jgi:hypothetical protein